MNVLILLPHYLPGFKAGGPIRSVANLVALLGSELDFHVVAADRDLGDSCAYRHVDRDGWQPVGRAQVRYLAPAQWTPGKMAAVVRESGAEVLYLNSFFNPRTAATPLTAMRWGLLPKLPTIVAPRGEFSAAALAMKRWKKAPYVAAMKAFGVAERAVWHATSELERDDVRRVIGPRAHVVVAPNLSVADGAHPDRRTPKRPGELRLAFLGRIAPKKNLSGALELLAETPGRVGLDVWGPVEDAAYWRRCQDAITRLPPRITVCQRGLLAPDAVAATLGAYDALLFPTLGENYGHVIVEALAAGCPAVISDRTPWRRLEHHGVGWDLPLERPAAFHRALAALSAMDEPAHAALRRRAARFGRDAALNPASIEASRALFRAA